MANISFTVEDGDLHDIRPVVERYIIGSDEDAGKAAGSAEPICICPPPVVVIPSMLRSSVMLTSAPVMFQSVVPENVVLTSVPSWAKSM